MGDVIQTPCGTFIYQAACTDVLFCVPSVLQTIGSGADSHHTGYTKTELPTQQCVRRQSCACWLLVAPIPMAPMQPVLLVLPHLPKTTKKTGHACRKRGRETDDKQIGEVLKTNILDCRWKLKSKCSGLSPPRLPSPMLCGEWACNQRHQAASGQPSTLNIGEGGCKGKPAKTKSIKKWSTPM